MGNHTGSDSEEENSEAHTSGTNTRMGRLRPVGSANSPPEVGSSIQELVGQDNTEDEPLDRTCQVQAAP